MDKTKIGTFIREQRMALGMTQQQLAEQLHTTNKAISRWETGNAYPDISLLDDLAAALSVVHVAVNERVANFFAQTFADDEIVDAPALTALALLASYIEELKIAQSLLVTLREC